jgi:hypothetical protein
MQASPAQSRPAEKKFRRFHPLPADLWENRLSRRGYNAWRCVEAGPVLLVWGDDAKPHARARRRKWSSSALKKVPACL